MPENEQSMLCFRPPKKKKDSIKKKKQKNSCYHIYISNYLIIRILFIHPIRVSNISPTKKTYEKSFKKKGKRKTERKKEQRKVWCVGLHHTTSPPACLPPLIATSSSTTSFHSKYLHLNPHLLTNWLIGLGLISCFLAKTGSLSLSLCSLQHDLFGSTIGRLLPGV